MFSANIATTTPPNTAEIFARRSHCLRNAADTSSGMIKPTFVGLAKVAMPSKTAATVSDRGASSHRVRKAFGRSVGGAPTSL